ncbi:MAG: hypothetical protein IPJ17_18775 [Holophagales bacterium]|nr:MAG: hypothetical protein IPJ17_18775 [Holophagales bacterium]
MCRSGIVFLLLAVGALATVGAANGVVVVSNLAGTAAGNASPQSTFWMAQAFTTDNNPYTVTSVSIRGARNAAQSLVVRIYAHDAGNNVPVAGATGFGQFDATGVTTTVGVQTMPPIGTINLAANTTYWIVLQPSTIDTSLWTQSTSLGNLSGAGTIPNRRAFSSNSGTSWSGQTNGTDNLMIEVNVTTLPVELMGFSVE